MDKPEVAERIEREAWTDVAAAPSGPVREQLGIVTETLEGARLLAARHADSLLFNRALGGGADDLRRAARRLPEIGTGRFFLQPGASAAPDEVAAALAPLGIVPYHIAWMKFLRRATDPPPLADTPLPVSLARPADAGACGRILADAFDMPATLAPVLAALVGRPRWHVHVARDGDEPVATGALFVDGDTAYCAFAATRPSHRGRGAQRALLTRRLHAAAELGCAWVATETGEIVETAPNPSYHNILRAGFQEVYRRPNFVLEGTTWTGFAPPARS